jgi:hypothetical protein
MNPAPQPLTPVERDMRVFVALVLQPFLLGVLAFVLFPLVILDANGQHVTGGHFSSVNDAAVSVGIGVAIVAAAITLLGVMPAAVWVMKRHTLTLGHTLLFGLAFGNVPFVIGTAGAGAYGPEGVLRGFIFSSLLGLAGAAAFWAIALRRPVADQS